MRLVLRILGGLALIFIGCLFVIKTEWFIRNFGSIAWAEQNLGLDGGSRLFYKLLGVLIVLAGILMATGMMGNLLLGTVGKLFVPPSART